MQFQILVTDIVQLLSKPTDMLCLEVLNCVKKSGILYAKNEEEKEALTVIFLEAECTNMHKPSIEYVNL